MTELIKKTEALTPKAAEKITIPPYTKSQCIEFLKQMLGPTTRFKKIGDKGGLEVWTKHTVTGEQFPIVEVSPKNARDARHVPWLCVVAALKSQGFEPCEYGPKGFQVRALGSGRKLTLWAKLVQLMRALSAWVQATAWKGRALLSAGPRRATPGQ